MIDTGRITHYRKTIAILKSQIIGSQQSDITTEHTAHIHTIAVAHLKMSESLTIESRTGNHDDAAFHLSINGIPVHLIIIPLLIHFLTEENLHGRHLILIRHHQHIIACMKHGISLWHNHLFTTPDTRDDKLTVSEHGDFCNRITIECRIHNQILSDGSMVVIIIASDLQILRLHKEFAQQHHR